MSSASVAAAPRKRVLSLSNSLAIDCAIAAIAILPLLLTSHLPLLDLPNHLARQYILRDLGHSETLQQFYSVHWQVVPNLALEGFVFLASQVMSIDAAVRAFCITTILMLFFGARQANLLLSDFRSSAYRITPLLCYGGPFQFGFLSFCFGIGLSLVLFSLYAGARHKSPLQLIAVFAPLSFLLLLCHLAAFGLFAVAIGSLEAARIFKSGDGHQRWLNTMRRLGTVLAFLLPSYLLFKLLAPSADLFDGARFGTLREKVDGIAALTMFSSPAPELLLLGVAGAGLIGALLLKVVRLHAVGYIMAVIFTLIYLVMPRTGMGGGYIDYRIPWAASFFLLASLIPGAGYGRFAAPFGLGFGALVLARVGLIAWLWLSWEPILAGIDTALSNLPPGTRLMVVRGDPGSVSRDRQPPLNHVAGYAVARRQAFEANIFADFSGQILSLKEPYKTAWMLSPPSELDSLAAEYDYVLVLRPQFAKISSALPLVCEQRGREFAIWKAVSPHSPLLGARQPSTCS